MPFENRIGRMTGNNCYIQKYKDKFEEQQQSSTNNNTYKINPYSQNDAECNKASHIRYFTKGEAQVDIDTMKYNCCNREPTGETEIANDYQALYKKREEEFPEKPPRKLLRKPVKDQVYKKPNIFREHMTYDEIRHYNEPLTSNQFHFDAALKDYNVLRNTSKHDLAKMDIIS